MGRGRGRNEVIIGKELMEKTGGLKCEGTGKRMGWN